MATADSQPADKTPWHTLPLEQASQRLRTDPVRGLAAAEAARRLEQYGRNTLAPARGRSPWAILLSQFESLIVLLLVAATAIAFALGEHLEAVAILAVILLNAGIGFATEWRAERALAALARQTMRTAHVVRDGVERQIPAAELVPGDVVLLTAGARVPADGRICESTRLQIDEAALTGESQAVHKTTEPIDDPNVVLADRLNLAFMGTILTDGRGRMLVTATGRRTELGKIGRLIEEATREPTPLEQRLAQLGHALVFIVLGLCALIVLSGCLSGAADFWRMLEVGISLAIAAVPEGLPAVATMTLALGMQRMARARALIRRLPAVETLGSTTVICTDKTGTITKNEMTVRALVVAGRRIEVTGAGYAPAGEFQDEGRRIDPAKDKPLRLALRIGALCNDARIDRADHQEHVLGDPTEAALLVAAQKAGLEQTALEREYPRLAEVPFESRTKRMVTVHHTPDGNCVALVKGSPGTLLEASRSQLGPDGATLLTAAEREAWENSNRELAGSALRVLGLAYRELPQPHTEKDLTEGLTFAGLVGMLDPLREEAKAAIATCRDAGIRTVMITGDQPATAAEIARQLGIDRDPSRKRLRVVHGRELAGLDEAGWRRLVNEVAVFARVSPEHKLQIVEAFQRAGHIVAMTGDGVNDAPALKKADIGVAMGIKGTEVAQETADMVITDDNFATIVGAVEQGRIIYANIIRFIHYLFSCNLSEIVTVFVAIVIGWPLPLVALQVLWLNVITDVFPALALALEPSAPDIMKRPPRNPKEGLLTPRFVALIVWQGLLLSGMTLLAFAVGLGRYGSEADERGATTMAFMTLALAQVFHAFNSRSQRRSAFSRLFTNAWLWAAVLGCIMLQLAAVSVPLLQRVLHTHAPALVDWAVIIACSVAPLAVAELMKLTNRTCWKN
jgi:Ca2+-transporting ATPase